MVTSTINIPPMLAYIPYMDPMGYKDSDSLKWHLNFVGNMIIKRWMPSGGSSQHQLTHQTQRGEIEPRFPMDWLNMIQATVTLTSGRSESLSISPFSKVGDLKALAQKSFGLYFSRLVTADALASWVILCKHSRLQGFKMATSSSTEDAFAGAGAMELLHGAVQD